MFEMVTDLVGSVSSEATRVRYIDGANSLMVTPLCKAASFGFTEIVDYLLERGATLARPRPHERLRPTAGGELDGMGSCVGMKG